MIKFIVFDVGNVVIQADHRITHDMLAEYGVPIGRARKFFDNEEYNDFNRGKIDGRGFYNALVRKYLRFELSYEQVVAAHNAHIFGIDNKVVGILSELPKERLAFLTDTNEWQTEREKELVDINAYTERVFRSHQIHMIKTDKGCFPYVIGKLGAKAGEILLIDDSIEKVEMAMHYGMQTLQFKDACQLAGYLKDRNLLC